MSTPEIQLFELDDPGRCSVGFGLDRAFTPTWYKLRVRADAGFGAWEHTAEIVMDWEVGPWVEWLRDAARHAKETSGDARLKAFPDEPLAEFALCEPDLDMDFVAWGGGWARMRIMLRNEFDPTGRSREYPMVEYAFRLDMYVPDQQLLGLADHLERQASMLTE